MRWFACLSSREYANAFWPWTVSVRMVGRPLTDTPGVVYAYESPQHLCLNLGASKFVRVREPQHLFYVRSSWGFGIFPANGHFLHTMHFKVATQNA